MEYRNAPSLYNLKRKEHHETNDCTVVALATVCGVSYDDAHACLKLHGRKNRKGFAFAKFVEKFHKRIENNNTFPFIFEHKVTDVKDYPYFDWEREPKSEYCNKLGYYKTTFGVKRLTVKQFIKDNPKGKFVLKINRHVLTVINGVVNDYKNSQYCEVMSSYKFEKL